MQAYIAAALTSYFMGSVPFGYLLVRSFKKEDIREVGSGNIGATNVARSGAKFLAAATLALDILKGVAATWVAEKILAARMGVDAQMLAAFATLFVVLGHCFPVWLKFKGGKGVATALGAFLVLTPKAALVALSVFIVIVWLTHYVSLGSIIAAVAVPSATYVFGGMETPALLLLTAPCLVVIAKHHQNIGRLISGTENKFGAKPA